MSADLGRLLPHRPPMVLLDRVESVSGERCVAGWTVPADSPWLVDGLLVRPAFIEIAAQTAAVHAATADTAAEGDVAPRMGFLGGVNGFRVHGDAGSGDVLRSTAVRAARFGPVSRFDFRIERVAAEGAKLLAEGSLTVVRPDSP